MRQEIVYLHVIEVDHLTSVCSRVVMTTVAIVVLEVLTRLASSESNYRYIARRKIDPQEMGNVCRCMV